MKVIFGLGNPGSKYEKTRHNIGQRLIHHLASEYSFPASSLKKNLKSHFSISEIEGHKICLAKSDTFMNLSGEAIAALCAYFDVDSKRDLLVVSDDADLSFGRLKLKPEGGTGGHNGLKSTSERLGHSTYARLRVGVGAISDDLAEAVEPPLEDFVLSRFSSEEEDSMAGLLERCTNACLAWSNKTMALAMNEVNEGKGEN